MLFLSMNDFSSAPPDQTSSTSGANSEHGLKDGVKERLVYDLSLANERLEMELKHLKQYVLDIRRSLRQAGCQLEDSSVLTLYPELHEMFNEKEEEEFLKAAAGDNSLNRENVSMHGHATGNEAEKASKFQMDSNTSATTIQRRNGDLP